MLNKYQFFLFLPWSQAPFKVTMEPSLEQAISLIHSMGLLGLPWILCFFVWKQNSQWKCSLLGSTEVFQTWLPLSMISRLHGTENKALL